MNRHPRSRRASAWLDLLAAAALLAILAGVAAQARAGTVSLKVLDASGQPAADVAVVVQLPGQAVRTPPLPPTEVVQERMRFVPAVLVVTPGTRVRFVNRDSWDHHVRGTVGQSFEFRLPGSDSQPRKELATAPELIIQGGVGPVVMNCLLHSRMQGAMYVADTPWFGVTRADGTVEIPGVPDGAAELTLWHPQQFLEQTRVKLQVAPGALPVQAALNFSPRRAR